MKIWESKSLAKGMYTPDYVRRLPTEAKVTFNEPSGHTTRGILPMKGEKGGKGGRQSPEVNLQFCMSRN